MLFWKKVKNPEKVKHELKVLWVHDHAPYLTYVDEVNVGQREVYFEGPHVKGDVEKGDELLVLDCNGEKLARVQVTEWETRNQGTLLGSVNTGRYLQMSGTLVSGDKYDVERASMIVNADLDLNQADKEVAKSVEA